eukprot:11580447-Alexandrium_andersonii.AAC.1
MHTSDTPCLFGEQRAPFFASDATFASDIKQQMGVATTALQRAMQQRDPVVAARAHRMMRA